MESGFKTENRYAPDLDWQPIIHKGSRRFEFFKVRHFGALHFVKRPTAAYRHDLVTTEAINKEFYIGYTLNHPNIVRYIKLEDGAVFEEYIDGLSLREMIDSGDDRLKYPDFIKRICRQLLEATSYLHSQGVVHNDIKPENVMIARIGDQLKLVDLGAATSDMWDATEGFTIDYKAPEQGIEATNVQTDIYLIGKLMQELASIARDYHQWKNFIGKATAENPSDRFQSDAEAIAAIPAGKNTIKLPILALAFLLIGICAIWMTWHRQEKEGLSDLEGTQTVVKEDSSTDSATANDYTLIPGEPSQEPIPSHQDQPQSSHETEESSAETPTASTKINTIKAIEYELTPPTSINPPTLEAFDYGTIPSTPTNLTKKEAIDYELKRLAIDRYKNLVYPECKRYGDYVFDIDRRDCNVRIEEMEEKADKEINNFTETLCKKYPDEADYCRTQAALIIKAQHSETQRIRDEKPVKTYEIGDKRRPLYNTRDYSSIPGEKIARHVHDNAYFDKDDGYAFRWLVNHIKYPPNAKKNRIQGRVLVEVIIEKDGSVSHPFILKGIDPELDKEALRLASIMPKWESPAKLDGIPVRAPETVEVYFGLP